MTEPLLRVVLDINIIVSSYFFSNSASPPRKVYEAALSKRYRLLHSSDYCDDLRAVLNKEKFTERLARIDDTAESIVDTVRKLGDAVQPASVPVGTVRDADDVLILACAAGGKADYIVTGDNDLLVLKTYQEISIVTPAHFLTIMSPTP